MCGGEDVLAVGIGGDGMCGRLCRGGRVCTVGWGGEGVCAGRDCGECECECSCAEGWEGV